MDTGSVHEREDIVQDSEDEEMEPPLIPAAVANSTISNASHFSPTMHDISSVSASSKIVPFTEPSAVTPSAAKPRPRPRPIKPTKSVGESLGEDPISTATTNPRKSTFFDSTIDSEPLPSTNIADRAKLRSRKARAKSPIQETRIHTSPGEVIELSSDGEDELAGLLPSPLKMPLRRIPKAIDQPNANLDTSKPVAKPRPKPKPVNKALRARSPPPPFDPTSQNTIPVATSPIRPIPGHLFHSDLPPSDPPSTFPQPESDLPPIAVLDGLPSSPLFSPPHRPNPRFRKNLPSTPGIDELDSADDSADILPTIKVNRKGKVILPPPPPPPSVGEDQPPPTFFAGSSSLSVPGEEKLVTKDLQTPKPKKPRRKKSDDDDDFNEAAQEGSKSKGKPKPKPRAKAKPALAENRAEVVIETPKVNSVAKEVKSTGKRNGKGKGKETQKEVFKSAEFVEDEDEEYPVEKVATSSSNPRPQGETLPTSASASRKRKSDASELDSPTSPPKKTKADAEKHSGGRSRKSKATTVVSSDDEDDVMQGKSDGEDVTLHREGSHSSNSAKPKAVKGKLRHIADSDDEMDILLVPKHNIDEVAQKENVPAQQRPSATKTDESVKESLFPSITSRYTIAPRTKPTPMSELIRRANSHPSCTPSSSPVPRASPSSRILSTPKSGVYSPYLKSSRSALSRMAPLHPNRRTPPPPPPRPPPPKKSKKEKEREERWEEELIESVGGITDWACLPDAERKELRRIKWEREMGGWED